MLGILLHAVEKRKYHSMAANSGRVDRVDWVERGARHVARRACCQPHFLPRAPPSVAGHKEEDRRLDKIRSHFGSSCVAALPTFFIVGAMGKGGFGKGGGWGKGGWGGWGGWGWVGFGALRGGIRLWPPDVYWDPPPPRRYIVEDDRYIYDRRPVERRAVSDDTIVYAHSVGNPQSSTLPTEDGVAYPQEADVRCPQRG